MLSFKTLHEDRIYNLGNGPKIPSTLMFMADRYVVNDSSRKYSMWGSSTGAIKGDTLANYGTSGGGTFISNAGTLGTGGSAHSASVYFDELGGQNLGTVSGYRYTSSTGTVTQAHTHTIASGWATGSNGIYPESINVGLFRSLDPDEVLLPANTLIMLPGTTPYFSNTWEWPSAYEGLNPVVNTYSSSMGSKNNAGNGDNVNISITTSVAGSHDHQGSTYYTFDGGGPYSVVCGFGTSGGGHTHSTGVSVPINHRWYKCQTFRAKTETPITVGMMFFLRSNSSGDIPPNFYLCDGRTISTSNYTITLPDFTTTARYIKMTNVAHGNIPAAGSDTTSFTTSSGTITDSITHYHYGGYANRPSYASGPLSGTHGSQAVSHSHTISSLTGTYTVPYASFPIVMYIP